MSRRSDFRVITLVSLVAVLSGLLLTSLWRDAPAVGGWDLVASVTLGLLISLGRLFPLPVAFRRRMVIDTAPLFAAGLLLPPHLAALVSVTAIAPAELITGLRSQLHTRQVVFNTCQAMAGVSAAAVVMSQFAASDDIARLDGAAVAGLFLGGIAMFVVNDLMIFSVVWAQVGLRFHRMVWDYVRNRNDLPFDLALYAAGALTAVVGSGRPLLLWVLALPLPVVYRAMRNQVALRVQTREAVIALADIVDERDPYTFGHCKRVAAFAQMICERLGLPHDESDEIVLAARVHDVGKVGIRDAVLLKPQKLTDEEYGHIKLHPDIGARLTARFPDFSKGTSYIRHHHEKWDGTGYPFGLKGKEIPLGARVIAVADTYDAITSTRVYREGLTEEFARAEMARVAGTQLDPQATAAWFHAKGWGELAAVPDELRPATPPPLATPRAA